MTRSSFTRWMMILLLCMACRGADVSSAPAVNPELEKMYSEDQSDRQRTPIDWSIVGPRDSQRQKRVMEMYRAGELKAGEDFFHAAMILQHGSRPEDFLLCHELCITAIFVHGDKKGGWIGGAKWLAAASEDRFLGSIGRNQRFGTQYKTHDPDPQWRLDPVDDDVTDWIRKAWSVPSIAEAKRRETEMNKGREEVRPIQAPLRTPGSVTPAADAPVAPPPGVPHL
jgi:hypothetical protein